MRTFAASLLLLGLAGAAAAEELTANEPTRVRLRRSATVTDANVTFADVLDFTGSDPRLAELIGATPVFEPAPQGGVFEASYDHVVARLNELGVNLSYVLVSGALSCKVTMETPTAAPTGATNSPETQPTAGASHLLRPAVVLAGAQGATLGHVAERYLAAEFADLGGQINVEFEVGSRQYLSLTRPPYSFSVRGVGRSKQLGMRELSVTIRRDGKVVRTVSLYVNVTLTKPVVVAAKPLNQGVVVRPDTVEMQDRIFGNTEDIGVDALGPVVGQQVKRYVPVGEMVRQEDIQSGHLVRQSRIVTVLGGASNVSLKSTGRALESGGYGETIRVRLGASPQSKRIVRAVVTGLGEVRLIES